MMSELKMPVWSGIHKFSNLEILIKPYRSPEMATDVYGKIAVDLEI